MEALLFSGTRFDRPQTLQSHQTHQPQHARSAGATIRRMTTFIILAVVAVAFIVMLGAAFMFIYFCGAIGGAVAGWAFGVKDDGR